MYELDIEMLASAVGDGQHSGLKCPACGAHTNDRALSMRVEGNSIQAICHRASCGFKYQNKSRPIPLDNRPSRVRPYTGELRLLDAPDERWLYERFHLLDDTKFGMFRKSDGRYFIPIISPEGRRRGWVSRRPWEGSPLYDGDTIQAKSLTYMENEEPVQSWYGTFRVRPNAVVAVEDQISAMRVGQDTRYPAVALLGTGMNEEKVAEIQRHAKHLIIALDEDATGQAFSHARKWGQAFDSCRVVILRRDIKDDTCENVAKIFS